MPINKTYEPMIAALERHPGVRLALHYSGPLRDWLKAHQPDFLKRVRTLVGRRQVEILTGGYYEPVLIALPDADKLGQIAKMTKRSSRISAWSRSGRGWPSACGSRICPRRCTKPVCSYTIVDDTHFQVWRLHRRRSLWLLRDRRARPPPQPVQHRCSICAFTHRGRP